MNLRKLELPLLLLAATFALANLAYADGYVLGETKEQLKLQYDVTAVDHGTGRVSVTLTIADAGRLAPIDTVDLVIPSQDGTNYVDLSLSLNVRTVNGKQQAYIHLMRDLAMRGQLQVRSSRLDGKREELAFYVHKIPLAEYFKTAETKAK